MSFSFDKGLRFSRFNRPIRRPERARIALGLEPLEGRWLPNGTIITVTTAADDPTTPIAGQTTFRDALNQANQTTGATIEFAQNLKGQALQPTATLPMIQAAGTTIDGTGLNIALDGSKCTAFTSGIRPPDGASLDIAAGNVTIEGLTIEHWGIGIELLGGNWYFGNIDLSGTTISNNIIENNSGYGISVAAMTGALLPATTNVNIVGNTISGNGSDGVRITGNQNVVKGNHIYDNQGNGVNAGGSQNTIQGNSISGNGGLGILNNLTPAPVLTSWIADGSGGAVIEGHAITDGANSGWYTLEFFATASSSNPQGGQFLGTIQVMPTGSEPTTFAFDVPSSFSNGSITATVTDPSGNTSEFSNAISPPQDPPSDPPAPVTPGYTNAISPPHSPPSASPTPATPPPSSFQAAFALFVDGAEMLFDQLAAYANPNLAGVNASIAADLQYAGQFANWLVLAGEAAMADQLRST